MSHTPGPWAVGEDDKHGQAVVRNAHIEIATCWHHSVGAIEKEMRDNAALIAAAPDLLAALKEAEGYIAYRVHGTGGTGETNVLPVLRAAISKAESTN